LNNPKLEDLCVAWRKSKRKIWKLPQQAHCASVLKNVVDYYTARGSHVFTCFDDFTMANEYTAFDRVNCWKLFNKLLDGNVPYNVVVLLSFWYSHQQVNVRWHDVLSGVWYEARGHSVTISIH